MEELSQQLTNTTDTINHILSLLAHFNSQTNILTNTLTNMQQPSSIIYSSLNISSKQTPQGTYIQINYSDYSHTINITSLVNGDTINSLYSSGVLNNFNENSSESDENSDDEENSDNTDDDNSDNTDEENSNSNNSESSDNTDEENDWI